MATETRLPSPARDLTRIHHVITRGLQCPASPCAGADIDPNEMPLVSQPLPLDTANLDLPADPLVPAVGAVPGEKIEVPLGRQPSRNRVSGSSARSPLESRIIVASGRYLATG